MNPRENGSNTFEFSRMPKKEAGHQVSVGCDRPCVVALRVRQLCREVVGIVSIDCREAVTRTQGLSISDTLPYVQFNSTNF